MNENLSFYKFMHKQIMVVIWLNIVTVPGYLLMGYLYTSMIYEFVWATGIYLMAMYGFILYRKFNINMSIIAKRSWATKARIFMYVYLSSWVAMFVYYVSFDNLEMHYITIATELGTGVVAATLLASERKIVNATILTLMVPLIVYFLIIGGVYGYILSFFSAILTAVVMYSASNTNDYLVKSNYQAYHDYLTGLGNRRYFLEILENSVRDNKNSYSYLLLIDLDYFKMINDTLGHDIGDELLKEIANRMNTISKDSNNTVARLGGDEFCVLSKAFESEQECYQNAEKFSDELLSQINQNYVLHGNNLYISASIGVSIINTKSVDANEFLKEADMAMYEAKNNGRGGVMVFNEELYKIVQEKLDIERLLHFAIEKEEISLVYQPQVDVNKKVVGCEVLCRWNSQELGFVAPNIFIEVAESTGFIVELGEYILEEAFKTIQNWSNQELCVRQVSINISIRQLLNQNFPGIVERLFAKYIDKECKINIVFEITETSTSNDLEKLIVVINSLKEYNIKFSMDDFGTGYSSLSYLRDIPLDELKIDQMFISQILDKKQAALVKTIVDISKNLDLAIVAEGVEEDYQREFLVELNCDLYQGYLFSKPVSKNEFEQFCKK